MAFCVCLAQAGVLDASCCKQVGGPGVQPCANLPGLQAPVVDRAGAHLKPIQGDPRMFRKSEKRTKDKDKAEFGPIKIWTEGPDVCFEAPPGGIPISEFTYWIGRAAEAAGFTDAERDDVIRQVEAQAVAS